MRNSRSHSIDAHSVWRLPAPWYALGVSAAFFPPFYLALLGAIRDIWTFTWYFEQLPLLVVVACEINWMPSGLRDVNFKSSNKYLQIFQQLKVPTDIYKSSNNITVPTEIYKSSNNKNCTNRNLQIVQQISTNLPTINNTNKDLPVPPYTDPELPSTN